MEEIICKLNNLDLNVDLFFFPGLERPVKARYNNKNDLDNDLTNLIWLIVSNGATTDKKQLHNLLSRLLNKEEETDMKELNLLWNEALAAFRAPPPRFEQIFN